MSTQPVRADRRRYPRSLLGLLALAAAGTPLLAEPPAFKIHLEADAAYRVRFEDLAAAGLEATAVPSAGLGLTNRGQAVPIWVEDGGDGRFEAGDWLEFLGRHLAGERSYFDEHSRTNVYRLRLDASGPARLSPRRLALASGPATEPLRLRRDRHLEEDLLLIRLPALRTRGARELPTYDEHWFWEKLVMGREPSVHELDLGDLDPTAATGVDLRIDLRGWTEPREKDEDVADHEIEVLLNGKSLQTVAWDGKQPRLVELTGLAAELFARGTNRLALAVPKRQQADGKPLIDVVLLNWIEVSYPRTARVEAEQVRVSAAGAGTGLVELASPDAGLLVYGDEGWRASAGDGGKPTSCGGDGCRFTVAAGVAEGLTLARGDGLASPERVSLDRPSRWADPGQRADYVMIVHHRLREAVLPLAELHRRRGLEVAVVDVEDVYDEFNDGIPHPAAIRDFLAYAYHRWTAPAPRFVLLVGDASWDSHNETADDERYADWTARPGEQERFAKNTSTPYSRDGELNHRQLVPTSLYETFEGHAASDNAFVLVDGDDELPDMAIGRFPVVEPAEVAAIVAKTIRYVEEPETGPWRRRMVFITNELSGFQRRSDRVAAKVEAAGYVPLKVYPSSSETSNEENTRELAGAFDEGALLVHFSGHGGRYIWRTGPPDLKKNHDLFTLDDLDHLHPTGRLPVVLSLTCYSAPFDHPNADSIGEKLLRIPDRGAIAVIAASWRNSPSVTWGEALVEELTTPGATVGEALMRAKRRLGHPLFVQTYNLLGDPAVPVALPEGTGTPLGGD